MDTFLVLLALGAIVLWLRRSKAKSAPAAPSVRLQSDPVARPSIEQSPEEDSWEGSFWDVPAPLSVTANFQLRYKNGAGVETQRAVTVRQFGPVENAFLLIGHCHLRNATRTFRTDRILQCVDTDTGEVVADVGRYLQDRYESSPEAALDRLLESDYDVLRVLLFIGKADGALRAPERAIILDTARVLSNDSRLSSESLDRVVKELETPSLQAFKIATGRLSQRAQAQRELLLGAARAMVATQTTIHPAEQEALDYLGKRFSSGAA